MDNFYKQNGSYFTTSGKKIKDLTELQTFAKAGGKEVSAPTIPQGSSAIPNPSAISNYNVTANVGGTLYGTPKSPMNTATFNAGQTPTPELPNSNPALGIYADRSAQDATQQQTSLQKELDSLKAQRITDTQTALKAQQDNLKTIQGQKDADMAGYDAQFDPLKDKAVGIYDSMLDSIKDTNYKELTQQKLDLTNDIVKYSQMMRDDLDAEASQPGLLSISTGRQNAIKENYTSKIAIAQAAQSAIDGNFNLAFDIMDRGASAIERLTSDRINFINSVQTLYGTKENTAISEVLRLTREEKEGLDNAVKDAETKLANIQKNKETIMEIMQTNPIIANKAGLSLTDTPEQITEKLNKFYVANPQYTPENQSYIKQIREKYFDAGITLNDSLNTVISKLKTSKLYQEDTASNFELTTDSNGNQIIFNPATGNISDGSLLTPGTVGGQCGDYVHKIVDGVPALGNTYVEKMARANVSTNQWKIGDVLIQKTSMPYGHVSVVTAVNGNQVTVTESNWNLDEKVGTRTLAMGDKSVTGVYRGGTMKQISSNDSTDYWVDILNKGQASVSNIPQKIRNEVVARAGQTNTSINKPLSDTAIKDVEQTKSALASLDVLETKIKENLEFVGPISGWQKLNPWSEARKVQADVDRVRQTVGKALEGGVLRKEDEEKYKKILATLTDTPETAIYKIQALRDTLNRDIESYLSSQQASGRYTGGIVTNSSQSKDADTYRNKYDY